MPAPDPFSTATTLERVIADGIEFRPGDRVRLRPLGRADVFDLALDGRAATIEAIEQDFEDRIYLAVTVDDDPGREFGLMRKAAHRFFFRLEEVELLGRDDMENG